MPGLERLLAQVEAQERVQLERCAVRIAQEAGALVRDQRPDRLGVHHTKSSDLDVVTVMDTRSEQLLRDRIEAARPDDGILGEESGGGRIGRSGLTWVLDPIDGTVNYLYDLPGYAVSVAVVVGDPLTEGAWTPVAGAVYSPRVAETFHAHAGGGAWLTDVAGTRSLSCSTQSDLGLALLATGFAYDREVRRRQARIVADLIPRVRDIRRMGAAAIDLAHVAAGRVDGYWEQGTKAWDMAAGVLLVAEAGGLVTGSAPASAPGTAMVVAAGAALHESLRSDLEALQIDRVRAKG